MKSRVNPSNTGASGVSSDCERQRLRLLEYDRLVWCAVVGHGVLAKGVQTGRQDSVVPTNIYEDVLRILRPFKPVRVIECARVDPAAIREPLEAKIEFGAACRAEV